MPVVWFFLAAFGDEVLTTDGRVLEGRVEDLGTEVRITRGLNSITLPRSMVREIRFKPTREETYARRAKGRDPRSADSCLELARWCREAGLEREADAEYARVLTLDSENEEAHRALGHRKDQERWVTEAEYYSSRGMVRYKDRWIPREEKEVLEEARLAEESRAEEARRVRKLIGVLTDDRRRGQAAKELDDIPWPSKLKIFLANSSSSLTRVRRYVAGKLGESRDAAALPCLVRLWLYDEDEETRRNAGTSAAEIGAPEKLVNLVLAQLFVDRRDVRLRAADWIGSCKDLRAAAYLADALQAVMEEAGEVSLDRLPKPIADRPDKNRPPEAAREPAPEGKPSPGTVREDKSSKDPSIFGRKIVLPDGTVVGASHSVRALVPAEMNELKEIQNERDRKQQQNEKERIVRALEELTGKSYGADLARWREWLAREAKKN